MNNNSFLLFLDVEGGERRNDGGTPSGTLPGKGGPHGCMSSRRWLSKRKRGCLVTAPEEPSVQFPAPPRVLCWPHASVLPCDHVGHRAFAPSGPSAWAAFLPLLLKFYSSLKAPSKKVSPQVPSWGQPPASLEPPRPH